jgi:hypothetical protein
MADIGAARKRRKKGALARLKERQANGAVKPKGALAVLRERKQAKMIQNPSLEQSTAGWKSKPLAVIKNRSKQDFVSNGIRYHNAVIEGEGKTGEPYGSVDVSTGDITRTFHNRYRAWFTDLDGEGHMKEPRTFEIASNIQARWLRELKDKHIKSAAQKRIEQEEQDRARRKRRAAMKAAQRAKKAAQQSS